MVFTTQCPRCGKVLWFASNRAGKMTICPACGAVMTLTVPEGVQPGADAGLNVKPLDEGQAGGQVNLAGIIPPGATSSAGIPQGVNPQGTFPQGTAPQATWPDQPMPVEQIEDETAPASVQDTYLTHQAAAAVGEVHVEPEESDVVEWTMQGSAGAPIVPAAPPEWAPPPIAQYPPQVQREFASEFPAEFQPSATGPAQGRDISEISAGSHRMLWAAGAAGVVLLVLAMLWLLSSAPTAKSGWEVAHRDDILGIKQDAEQLALEGKYREAYDRYQELEKLVSGQTIQDPYLNDELKNAWRRRDSLYDYLTSGHATAGGPGTPVTPTTAPSVVPAPETLPAAEQPAAAAPGPTSQAAQSAPVTKPSDLAFAPIMPPTTAPAVKEVEPEAPRRPAVKPDIPAPVGVTDAQIGVSITKGVNYLLTQFTGPQITGTYDHYEGLDTLAVYALMQAGIATNDKRLDIHGQFIVDAIASMKKFTMSSDYVTYARALRSTALALYDRPQDHYIIKQDVDWLLQSQEHGAFTYNNDFARNTNFSFWDNSNSQYGLLGVWSGAEVGLQVPSEFWREVRAHWTQCQMPDGEWCYRSDQQEPSRSMTLAGIASLFVAQDYLDGEDFGDQVGRPPFTKALATALAWLEDGDHSAIPLPPSADFFTYYALYGLERTGLASGFKYYGVHDWYRERAADIVAVQQDNGAWGGTETYETIIDTSYSLLFLARGRHPILMNKLLYQGNWANRPRDVANLARFASAELERPLNWQVVPLDHDWADWTDSPVLFLAGNKRVELTPDDVQKLRNYVEAGNLLLTQADANSPEFSAFAEELGKKLFPQYQWTDLAADDPVLSVAYRLSDVPKIRVISNGSRILMMHWPIDQTHFWQLRQDKIGRTSFELGVNLALYAAGKSELKNRLSATAPVEPSQPPAASLTMARVRYDGNWNPEPEAWTVARRWFREQTSLGLNVKEVTLADLGKSHLPLAHLTGTGEVTFNATDVKSVQEYVEGGGVLVIDPCGKPDEFLRSVDDHLLSRAFPIARRETAGDGSPLLSGKGDGMRDLSHAMVRQYVRSYAEGVETHPQILKAGAGHVIILPMDMTSGLLGTDAWGIVGYQPEYALELMENIVLWTWDGGRDDFIAQADGLGQ
jgi:hypothetical protein